MEKLKSMVDISSFMLSEATGDSETYNIDDDVHDDESILGTSCMSAVADEEEDDDDDAQSCSYDDSILDSGSILKRNGVHVQRDHPRHTHVKQHQHQHHDDDDDEEEGEVIDQKLHDRVDDDDVVVLMRKHKKLRVCGDSNMDMINEVQKNKLFWDACLAS